MVRNLAIVFCLSFAAAAQQPAAQPAAEPAAPAQQPAPAAGKPAAAPEKAAVADQAISADGKMHIDAAVAFLKAWGKGRWDDAKTVAADKVPVKIGDKSYDVDVAGGKSDVKAVLPFRGLSTVREQGKVVAIAVSDLALRTDSAEKRGKARLTTEDKDGQVRVTAVELE
jgi:hypothetical protein